MEGVKRDLSLDIFFQSLPVYQKAFLHQHFFSNSALPDKREQTELQDLCTMILSLEDVLSLDPMFLNNVVCTTGGYVNITPALVV